MCVHASPALGLKKIMCPLNYLFVNSVCFWPQPPGSNEIGPAGNAGREEGRSAEDDLTYARHKSIKSMIPDVHPSDFVFF